MIKHFTCALGLLVLATAPSSVQAGSVEASGSTNGSAGNSSAVTNITGLISPTEANGSGSASGSFGTGSPLDGYLDLQDVDLPKTHGVLRRINHIDIDNLNLTHGHSGLNLPLLHIVGTLSSSIGH